MTNGCPAHQDKILTELKEVKDHLSGKIEDINERLLDPDEGIYVRVGRNTAFRKTTKRWLWMITGGLLIAIGRGLYDFAKKVVANA